MDATRYRLDQGEIVGRGNEELMKSMIVFIAKCAFSAEESSFDRGIEKRETDMRNTSSLSSFMELPKSL